MTRNDRKNNVVAETVEQRGGYTDLTLNWLLTCSLIKALAFLHLPQVVLAMGWLYTMLSWGMGGSSDEYKTLSGVSL